ncbi:MAG: hypothetical protein ACRDTZ_24535, partial [Pseudonocardiaceae bacterium]
TRTVTVHPSACGYDAAWYGYSDDNDPIDVEVASTGVDFDYATDFTQTGPDTFVQTLAMNKYNDTGRWVIEKVTIWDADYSMHDFYNVGSFDVRRNTALTFNAWSEPITRGGYLNLTGNLRRLDPYYGYRNYGSRRVNLSFKAVGRSTYTFKAMDYTDGRGNYVKKIRTWHDGTWRACVAATASYVGGCRYDYVNVR